MSVTPGQMLSHYRIDRKIGQGGMGEVWAATDTRLNRPAAIKALPDALVGDPERLARFRREAQILASLNHPNIAGIYGLEQEGKTSYLAMELVEGDELAARLESGPIPVDEALEIAAQIAAALEEAHDKGIVHRDLKPANIKVTPDAKVKILDFGLAKALAGDNADSDLGTELSMSPTMTAAMGTQAGIIMGTAAYMSPEQARGKVVDRRADIWAFGVVLFEMLTGGRMFGGETATDIIAAVVTRELAWDQLPDETPAGVRRLLRRCLQRDPRQRLRDIGDARFDLATDTDDEIQTPASEDALQPTRRGWLWAAAGIFAGAALTAMALTALGPREPSDSLWSGLFPPQGTEFAFENFLGISPDGRHVAFVAPAPDGSTRTLLWVRDLDSEEARPLNGTEEAYQPFWSPDSQFIAYFSNRKLRKVSVSGGVSTVLGDAGMQPRGAAWGKDGTILFSPDWSHPLFRISDHGGTPTQVTELDASRLELSHRWPHFLPDGNHFLYYTVSTYPQLNPDKPSEADQSGLYLGSFDGGEPRLIHKARSRAVYHDGSLLFVDDGVLIAQAFDLSTFEFQGAPFSIAEGVTQSADALWGGALFSISDTGRLLFVRGASESRGVSRLVLRDRQGEEIAVVGDPASYNSMRISHDGKRVAVSIGDPGDVWILGLDDGTRTRFTFDPGNDLTPQWSPDDSQIIFQSSRILPGQRFTPANLMIRVTSGVGAAEHLASPESIAMPSDWLSDGSVVSLLRLSPGSGDDILLYSVEDGTIETFLETEANEASPRFSPDGRWLAYDSDETGRSEVFVQAFPARGGKWQVSSAGGRFPTWRADGTELYYLNLEGVLMTVSIDSDDSFRPGTPTPLFSSFIAIAQGNRNGYDAAPDGQSFLLLEPVKDPGKKAQVTLVQNWPALLRR